MLNPLNAPPAKLEMLKSPPLVIDDAAVEEAVKAVLRETVFVPEKPRRRFFPEIEPAEIAPMQDEQVKKSWWPGYQPKWTHSAGILALALIIARPWFLPVSLGLLIASFTIAYLIVGHDRFMGFGAACFARYQRRNPERAETLRAWAIRRVERIERLLGHLPERWTAGIYLPDFSPAPDSPDKMQRDPFERFQSDQVEA